jgi:hypothetical protein
MQLFLLHDLTGLQLDLPERGAPLQTRALVEKAIEIFQALGIGASVVRIASDNGEARHRCLRAGRGDGFCYWRLRSLTVHSNRDNERRNQSDNELGHAEC